MGVGRVIAFVKKWNEVMIIRTDTTVTCLQAYGLMKYARPRLNTYKSASHPADDELLKTVAKRIRQNLRQTDTIIRLGGDEFSIVPSSEQEHSDALAATFHKIRSPIAEPLFWGENKVEVTASIGGAVYPDNGMDRSSLLMHADAAMYQAKALGRNHCQFFTTEINSRIREKWHFKSVSHAKRFSSSYSESCHPVRPS